PEGEPRPAEPTVVLPGDSLQWTHSFDQGSVAAYQCSNYLVKARDCFNLTSAGDPIATQYSNRAPIFDRTQIEITGNDITLCWNRPVPRFKSDDSFTAEVIVYQDSVTTTPFFHGQVFNKTCFTFFDVPPMHNYIFQVRETILDDLQQSCSETFVSSLSDPLVIPLDNLPPSVSFDAQALPVLPEESQGKVFLSWQGFSSLVVENFVVKWTSVETPTVTDSMVLAVVDTVLVEGLDIDKTYEFTVVAIDFLKQRSVANDIETVSFKPRWVFTPKPQRLMPACFRDSVTVKLDWVDDNLNPLDSTLGADSVFVELSIDPAFQFIKSFRGFKAARSFTFYKDEDYPFVNRQNDSLYVRVRAKDAFNHLSPWSTTYSELGLLSGRFDDVAPAPVTTFIDSTKAPDFMGTNRVNFHLSWADLGLRPAGRHWYRRAVIIAVLLLPTVALVNSVLIPMLAEEPFRNPQLYAIAPAGFSWSALLTMLVMAGVVTPFAEELVFRGLLFPWLRTRLGVPAAVLLSALCFATLHGAAILIPALTVVGAAFAVIYQRCGSLWPAIVAHSVFNGIMIVVLYALLAAGVKLP
ncbi:MAG: CPBP family intramembrane metalloprotease, partial [Proteobacteria bacterium]|nr:CPBP family intramembrane metalloprotease [Pseudomonadota bacterium]